MARLLKNTWPPSASIILPQVLWHPPSHRYPSPCLSTNISGICTRERRMAAFSHVCQAPTSAVFPYPNPLSTAQNPRVNRVLWLPVPTLPFLCTFAHPLCNPGWECMLSAVDREKIHPVPAECCSCVTLSRVVTHH